jgi:hypothetical protein
MLMNPVLTVIGSCLLVFPPFIIVLFVSGGPHNTPLTVWVSMVTATWLLYTYALARLLKRRRQGT